MAVAAPRGHAKSTVVSLVGVLHTALTKKSRFIIITSNTYNQAKLFLETIKRELSTNEMIKFVYGEQETDKWAEGEIELKCGVKIMAKGCGQQMRGLKYMNTRPDFVVLDDLENDELVQSKERREKLERWFNAEVLPSLAPKGRVVYVGTIIHEDALLLKVLTKYPGWTTRIYKAIKEDGTTLWPALYTIEKLWQIKENYEKVGEGHLFWSEYMNTPMDDSIREFKREFFKYYKPWELPQNLRIITSVDLAISKKDGADDTVVMTIGIGADNTKYVIEYSAEKMDLFETVEEIFKHINRHKSQILVIENVAYQEAMVQLMKKEMQLRNQYVKIEPVATRMDKYQRIRGLLPHYRMGKVFHRALESEKLEGELLSFPRGKHDDIPDALSLGLNFWNTPLLKIPMGIVAKGTSIKELMKKEFA